jgi:hypothetical protein
MFGRYKILKRLEWCENELKYQKELKKFNDENKKRKKGCKLILPPVNMNDFD